MRLIYVLLILARSSAEPLPLVLVDERRFSAAFSAGRKSGLQPQCRADRTL